MQRFTGLRADVDDRAAEDQRVVRRVLAGDRNVFGELVTRYQKLVASVAWRYGVRPEEIEDLVSEVFFKVYRNLRQYRPEHPFSTWLYRLTANHVLDHGRRSRHKERRAEMPQQLADPGPGPGERLEDRERRFLVRSALDQLRPRYREVLFLVYIEGLRVEQAARTLGVPQGTIKSRLLRGRDALRRVLVARDPGVFGH
jgi:RNA polymerase sigma-70 factor (ECF subfamily)